MKLTKFLISMAGVAVWACGAFVAAQSWQPIASSNVNIGSAEASQTSWEDKVLRRSNTLQWRSPRPEVLAQSPATTQQPVFEQTYEAPMSPSAGKLPMRGFSTSRRGRVRLTGNEQPEMIPPGEQIVPSPNEEIFGDELPQPSAGGEHYGEVLGEVPGGDCGVMGECGDCGPCGVASCDECCDFGYEVFDGRCGWWIRNLTLFVGGQGFKGPADGGYGNFGFHEGIGVSGPLGDPWNIGYQVGATFTQSNFSGPLTDMPSTDRTQYFTTVGLFRRALCEGLQFGVAWDYLHDRYYEAFDLHQFRSEIGYLWNECMEIGFYGAFGLTTNTFSTENLVIQYDPTDMYVLYLRRYFENGGEGRVWGGATGWGDGMIGADVWVPLGRSFAIRNVINYKIPKESRDEGGYADESWGLTLQLVWYPGRAAHCQRGNLYRPLFNIADNSLFMVDRVVK